MKVNFSPDIPDSLRSLSVQMILKLAGPVTKYTTPALVFYYLYILPPKTSKYEFLRNFSIAIFDWWIAVQDEELGREIIPLFKTISCNHNNLSRVRLPISTGGRSNPDLPQSNISEKLELSQSVRFTEYFIHHLNLFRFSTKHVPNNANQATDLYFSILDKDLDVSRKTRVQSLPVKTPPKKVEMRYRII